VPAGCEVSVLEVAMHDLQAEMHNKRREAYDQEDRLGTENPPVFATVQARMCDGDPFAAERWSSFTSDGWIWQERDVRMACTSFIILTGLAPPVHSICSL
jgi:hypothetical protein